jgi:hypothetical protein
LPQRRLWPWPSLPASLPLVENLYDVLWKFHGWGGQLETRSAGKYVCGSLFARPVGSFLCVRRHRVHLTPCKRRAL